MFNIVVFCEGWVRRGGSKLLGSFIVNDLYYSSIKKCVIEAGFGVHEDAFHLGYVLREVNNRESSTYWEVVDRSSKQAVGKAYIHVPN